jgi:hypothetical protein
VAPAMKACVAFGKESRMKLANANKLRRKSGGISAAANASIVVGNSGLSSSGIPV